MIDVLFISGGLWVAYCIGYKIVAWSEDDSLLDKE